MLVAGQQLAEEAASLERADMKKAVSTPSLDITAAAAAAAAAAVAATATPPSRSNSFDFASPAAATSRCANLCFFIVFAVS